MPVVTAAVAIFVERKVPSKTEATALLLLVSGVIISVFEGQASGSSYGITLSITGTLPASPCLPWHITQQHCRALRLTGCSALS